MQWWLILGTALAALICCGVYRRLALRWQLFDIPNARSSHTEPTPHGGGIGIYLAMLVGAIGMSWAGTSSYLMIVAGVLVVAGVLDDNYGLPIGLRLPLYALACALSIWLLLWPLPLWLFMGATLYALWILNLFNFMDGIDGIAASEALFATAAAGVLALYNGADWHYAQFCLLLAATCAGFLYWNWSPARLFMGDAGSIAIGFLLAMLSLLGQASDALPLLCWLILLAVFIADATVTLLWRGLTGQAVTQAHSLHMHQRLARHWSSHSRVVLLMQAYNLLWLLPLALLALLWPSWAWIALAAAYAPLLLGLLKTVKLP